LKESESTSTKEVNAERTRSRSSPISDLKTSGHHTCKYPNGLSCGVRLEAIPGTRGVHVDVVHVLDLREAEFGNSGLAMRAAILEGVNRPLSRVLTDVGLGSFMVEKAIPTPFGRVPLLLLQSLKGSGSSLVHETRTVYVVREDTRTSMDLSWLTDPGRVIAATDLSLARKSDMRAILPSIRGKIVDTKWNLLETVVKRGWLGAIASLGIAIGLISTLMVTLVGSGTLLAPLLMTAIATLMGSLLLSSSRRALMRFRSILAEEEEGLLHLGDRKCIDDAISENEDQLRLLGDISFVVSPLMAVVGIAIESGNANEAAYNACQILDECVRLAPLRVDTHTSLKTAGDEGLRKFVGLFDSLGAKVEEEELALAYVALTGHTNSPLSFSELVRHVEVLNNTLYHAGALRPDIKESVDDRINKRAMEAVVEAFDKSLAEDEDTSVPVITAESVSESKASSSERAIQDTPQTFDDVNSELLSEIRESSAEKSESAPPPLEQDGEILSAAEVLKSIQEKQKDEESVIVQTSLFESVGELMGLGQDQEVKEEEGGSAGA
jgi:hypothetical protein